MPETYVPSISEFQTTARKAFAYLVDDHGFSETRIDVVRYFNPCTIRYQGNMTAVIVSGMAHGYSTSVELIDLVSQSHEIERGIPLWSLLCLRAPDTLKKFESTGGQLNQIPIAAEALLLNGSDVLRGDFSVHASAMQLVDNVVEEQRARELEDEARYACFVADEEFRKANFSKVVAILSEYESILSGTNLRKLKYARSKDVL